MTLLDGGVSTKGKDMFGKVPWWVWAVLAVLAVMFVVNFVIGAIALAMKAAAAIALFGGLGYVALKAARR